jgi:sugar phosphate permease
VIAFAILRRPEPERGVADIETAAGRGDAGGSTLYKLALESEESPDPALVLRGHQTERSLGWALRYTLRIRTDVIVIVAGSLGDFFFSGLQVFAVLFAVDQYGISEAGAALLIPVVGVGALFGLVRGGRVGDALVERGRVNGRLLVALWSFPIAALVFLPALFVHSVVVALPFLVVGAAFLTAPNPVLDAVRLDVVHPELRGRAEGIRSLCRLAAQASAPLVLGYLSEHLAGGGTSGLRTAILVTIPLLAANGLVLIPALRSYPADVAAVAESVLDDRRAGTGDGREA